jgi:hypothetical protein
VDLAPVDEPAQFVHQVVLGRFAHGGIVAPTVPGHQGDGRGSVVARVTPRGADGVPR